MERTDRARFGNAAIWLLAGILHFVRPKMYRAIVPQQLAPWKNEIVFASGVAEFVGGVACIPERTKRGARWWLLATLIAVFPANIQMALNAERYSQIPKPLLWIRLPIQALFGISIWRGTK